MRTPHRCQSETSYKIDWHNDHTPQSHPLDFLLGCPATHYDETIAHAVNHAIEIEDLGGLGKYQDVSTLPWRFVNFYQGVINARDRLIAERDQAQVKLYA